MDASLSYSQAVEALSQMAPRGWRRALDRMHNLTERLNVPHGGQPAYFHVAGTNGKGSTTAFLQSGLTAQGFRTGSTYSPYVLDLRERIQVDGEWISEADFARLMSQLLPISAAMEATELGAPTEFEAKIALAMMHWNEQGCEAVALETGLGGRLDSTNIVDPACSIITSIGFDHMHILGDTIEQIAAEKAGIIKPGRPVAVGDLPEAATEVIRQYAREQGAEAFFWDEDFFTEGGRLVLPFAGDDLRLPLPAYLKGDKQRHNQILAAVALIAAEFCRDPDLMTQGLKTAWLPGRFQRIRRRAGRLTQPDPGGTTLVIDGAHNEEAARTLANTWKSELKGHLGTLVVGMLDGHEPEPFLRNIASCVKRVVVVPVDSPRAMPTSRVIEAAESVKLRTEPFPDLREAISRLLTEDQGPILIAGSVYLSGEACRLLGATQPEIL